MLDKIQKPQVTDHLDLYHAHMLAERLTKFWKDKATFRVEKCKGVRDLEDHSSYYVVRSNLVNGLPVSP